MKKIYVFCLLERLVLKIQFERDCVAIRKTERILQVHWGENFKKAFVVTGYKGQHNAAFACTCNPTSKDEGITEPGRLAAQEIPSMGFEGPLYPRIVDGDVERSSIGLKPQLFGHSPRHPRNCYEA